ncbi:hypothetical protein B0T24DRAFT_86778 [Lasiosphaeria ovina]|uniref:Mating-type switching protein swi10 n=1 Tax=Lasiosphaeria ovina TaxID=92902 RepID=A0AAE0NMX1_9PEZI|nr:hypothetical protein B0T24DRAFT_86778 [Lasiosphaeria ovina]
MERSKARPLADPQPVQAPVHKLRRKLQKIPTRQRNNVGKRPGQVAANEASSKGNKSDTANKQSVPALPCLSLPSPDLSDSKWAEFFRGSGCLHGQDSSPSQSSEHLISPVSTVPELSHLATHDAQPRSSLSSSDSPMSPASTTSATMGRRAKTPIYWIGQLENSQKPGNTLSKTPSLELIAEQYRALVDSPSSNSIYFESYSEPQPSPGGDDGHSVEQQTPTDAADESQGRGPGRRDGLVGGSPTSDDSTLVSFEEETVYFKPVSFSPEPTSPYLEHPLRSPSPTPDNLSLQICLDLLTRDLSSALAKRPVRTSPETSALQVWVMIEAYEKLRDELSQASLGNEELRPLQTVFDMWLRALYSVHDRLAGDGRSSDESDYEAELGAEDLD